jgi:uncharacterized protein YndB with AHSA1/START domain
MASTAQATPTSSREVTITRIFDAPRELVFRAWTEKEHLARWWGPHHYTNPECEVDLRVGGELRIVMRGPEGTLHPMSGVFREIVRPERLVFSVRAVDLEGTPLLEGLATVTFEEQDGKTLLTLQKTAVGLAPIAERMLDGMEMGWSQSLERLEALVVAA